MCAQPQNRVLKKFVLYFTREDFVSMPHVDVQHVVARVGPNDRAIAARNRVLQPDRIVLRIKRKKDFDVFVQASTRRFTDNFRVAPSMTSGGVISSRGGLYDSINGVAQGEKWTLSRELKNPGVSIRGGLFAEFICDDVSVPEGKQDEILGREKTRTRASVDLNALFEPIIKIIGVPQ